MTIDSTETLSDLCIWGSLYGVDKSPYNQRAHRHPYTAVYSLLFSRFKQHPVRFCEIGIGTCRSIHMWRQYFESAESHIHCFDRDMELVNGMDNMKLPRVYPAFMDVMKSETITEALRAVGSEIDVLLDDSSHALIDQVRIIECALPFIKSGGLIVIEDVYRETPNENFQQALDGVLDQFSYASFIVTEHANRWSPGWNNDKLLVLIKK